MNPTDVQVVLTAQDVMEEIAVQRMRDIIDDMVNAVAETYPASLAIKPEALKRMARKALIIAALTVYNGGK